MAGIPARIVNTASIEKALVAAFEDWAENDVNGRYWRQKFEEPYPYPGPETIRKEKPPAGDPRDILDTEALYESGIESFKLQSGQGGSVAEWHWDAQNSSGMEYAWFVHEGEGPYSRHPRPWTDELANKYLFEGSEIKGALMDAIEQHLASQ